MCVDGFFVLVVFLLADFSGIVFKLTALAQLNRPLLGAIILSTGEGHRAKLNLCWFVLK